MFLSFNMYLRMYGAATECSYVASYCMYMHGLLYCYVCNMYIYIYIYIYIYVCITYVMHQATSNKNTIMYRGSVCML